MSVQMMGAVIAHGPRDRTQFCVMQALANYADDFGFAWPSIETLASDSRCDTRTTMRILSALEAAGWLRCWRKKLNGKSNFYILNLDRIGVTVSPKARPSGLFTRLAKKSPDMLSPIFCAQESGDMDEFSGDNPQPSQVTSAESQVTNQGGSGDTAMPVEPLEPSVPEPSGTVMLLESPLPPTGGVTRGRHDGKLLTPEAVRIWARVQLELKQQLAGLPGQHKPSEIRPGENDFDVCFRDWTLVAVYQVNRDATVFVVDSPVRAETEAGLAKYQTRIERILRAYFLVGRGYQVTVKLKDAAESVAA